MSGYFIYISGIATILAFIVQIRDVFPKHREARRAILYLAAGVFFGSLFGSVNAIDINVTASLHPLSVFMLAVLVVIFLGLIILLIAATVNPQTERRNELYSILGSGIGTFIGLLLFTGIVFAATQVRAEKETLSNGELTVLAGHHIRRERFDEALMYLTIHMYRYFGSDPRRTAIREQIERIKIRAAKAVVRDATN